MKSFFSILKLFNIKKKGREDKICIGNGVFKIRAQKFAKKKESINKN